MKSSEAIGLGIFYVFRHSLVCYTCQVFSPLETLPSSTICSPEINGEEQNPQLNVPLDDAKWWVNPSRFLQSAEPECPG